MRWRPGPALWLILPLIAVAAFGVLLGFSLLRMVGIESDMRIDAERNMLWVTHQGEVAARRLSEAALLAASGAVSRDEVMLRFDILRSRLALMDEGPDLVLYFKHMMVLKGDPEYALHFNEDDALSPSQAAFAEKQLKLFDAWYADWSRQPEAQKFAA